MPDLDCRVAKLEQAVEGLRDIIAEEKNDHRRKMDKICEALDAINQTLQKQRGFIGGVTFTVGAVFSLIAWFFSSKYGT